MKIQVSIYIIILSITIKCNIWKSTNQNTKYKIEYYDTNNNKIKDTKGYNKYKIVYKDKHKKILREIYIEDGKELERNEYKYDKRGRIIKQKVFFKGKKIYTYTFKYYGKTKHLKRKLIYNKYGNIEASYHYNWWKKLIKKVWYKDGKVLSIWKYYYDNKGKVRQSIKQTYNANIRIKEFKNKNYRVKEVYEEGKLTEKSIFIGNKKIKQINKIKGKEVIIFKYRKNKLIATKRYCNGKLKEILIFDRSGYIKKKLYYKNWQLYKIEFYNKYWLYKRIYYQSHQKTIEFFTRNKKLIEKRILKKGFTYRYIFLPTKTIKEKIKGSLF